MSEVRIIIPCISTLISFCADQKQYKRMRKHCVNCQSVAEDGLGKVKESVLDHLCSLLLVSWN